MEDKTEQYIKHEVHLRVHDERFKQMHEVIKDIKETLSRMDDRMDNQFKWIIGTLVTMFLAFIVTK